MVLVRRLPYRTHLGFERQMRDMQRLMNALVSQSSFGQAGGESSTDDGSRESGFNPPADVYQENGTLVLDFELPGIDVDNDVEVEVNDGVLTVSGERRSERSEECDGSYLRERRVGRFSRSLSLPDGVDADGVEASYTNGVLKVCVPLPEESGDDGTRKIEISGSRSSGTKAVTTGTEDVITDDVSTEDETSSGGKPKKSPAQSKKAPSKNVPSKKGRSKKASAGHSGDE